MSLAMRLLACWTAVALLGACSVAQVRPTAGAPTTQDDPERMVVVTLAKPAGAGLRGAGSTWRGWDMGGSRYRVGVDVRGAVGELAQRYAMEPVDGWPIAALGVHCVVFLMQTDEPRETLLRKLADDERVESAQAMQVFATAGLRAPPRELQYSLKSMQIEPAHRWAQGRGVKVAVIDTGVDFAHPQLKDRVVRHFDFVGRGDARFEDDRHGTAVAGVIAAADDPQGMVGVAPRAEILALKACWQLRPEASESVCNTFTLARALAAAMEMQADVLNLSLAGPPDALLSRLVRAALDRGMLVVGALPDIRAGTAATAVFPTMVQGVIAVNSVGAVETGGLNALSAPGQDIITTAPRGEYFLESGSSFAAAHVSGVAALIREHRHDLSSTDLERLLMESSVSTGASPEARVVNACNAVTRALGGGPCS